MKPDLTAWALWAAAVVIPLGAHAAGVSFVLRDIDGGPYFLLSPLWCAFWQPVIVVGMLLKNDIIVGIALIPAIFIGGGMLLGSFVQLPLALIAPSDAIADTPRLEIFGMHAVAMLAGAASVALAARLASQMTSRSPS